MPEVLHALCCPVLQAEILIEAIYRGNRLGHRSTAFLPRSNAVICQPFFSRSEAVDLAKSYVVGLTLEGERKSVEPMFAKVHASERGMQRLLTEVKWDHEEVIRCYRQRMLAETDDPLRACGG